MPHRIHINSMTTSIQFKWICVFRFLSLFLCHTHTEWNPEKIFGILIKHTKQKKYSNNFVFYRTKFKRKEHKPKSKVFVFIEWKHGWTGAIQRSKWQQIKKQNKKNYWKHSIKIVFFSIRNACKDYSKPDWRTRFKYKATTKSKWKKKKKKRINT